MNLYKSTTDSTLNLAEIEKEIMQRSHQLDAGINALNTAARAYAEADHTYKKLYAEAFLTSEGAGVMREQVATQAALQARYEANLAEGVMKSAAAAIQARRAQISALQSLLAAHKAEADFARTGGGI